MALPGNLSVSVRRLHHSDLSHHARILVSEDVAVVDELAELGERNVYDDGRRGTLAIAPLIDRADSVLLLHDTLPYSIHPVCPTNADGGHLTLPSPQTAA
jgi:hypothetical protein